MLSAGTAGLPSDPAEGDDEEAAWKMKIVDVNRISKGVKAGSMMRYSALIVVGNANVSCTLAAWSGTSSLLLLHQHRLQQSTRVHCTGASTALKPGHNCLSRRCCKVDMYAPRLRGRRLLFELNHEQMHKHSDLGGSARTLSIRH